MYKRQVYANATQRISVEKDMIIQEIYVSKGDEVKPGDKLISFDMTLVEMELNIAKLKLQKQQQDQMCIRDRSHPDYTHRIPFSDSRHTPVFHPPEHPP